MKKYALIGGAVALLLLGLVFQRWSAITNAAPVQTVTGIQKERGIPVSVQAPLLRPLTQTLELTGTIFPFRKREVSARRGDEVTSSTLVLGKFVRQGEVVVSLYDRTVRAQLAAATAAVAQTGSILEKLRRGTRTQEVKQLEAALKAAEAQFDQAEKEYERMRNLEKTGSITRQNAERILSARSQATAGLEAARQRLSLAREGPQSEDIRAAEAAYQQAVAGRDLAQLALDQSVITAPIDGFVDHLFVEVGEQVGNNKPVFSLVDIHSLFLHVDVPQSSIHTIAPNQPVTILADQLPAPITGSVREIAPNADPVSRTYLVKVFFDNADLRLKPGMFARARFILEERPEAVTVPRECVIRDASGTPSLFVVEDGKARLRPVSIGIQANDLVEIASGVAVKDLIVTRGQSDLQAGVRVAITSGGAR